MSELLYDGILKAPLRTETLSKNNQWAGRTTIVSGSATQVVSTTAIKSDAIVRYGLVANTRQSSGFANTIEVSSINHGNFFVFAWADANNLPARDTTIMWEIVKGS